MVGTVEYLDYSNKNFDSQLLGTLSAQANWSVIPQRLDFSIEDDAGVQPVDTLASNSPNNEQQTNVLSLGPILHFQFNGSTRGQAELKYLNSYASKVDDFDSSRGLGAFRVIRDSADPCRAARVTAPCSYCLPHLHWWNVWGLAMGVKAAYSHEKRRISKYFAVMVSPLWTCN